jgi:hypothetical protein
LTSTGHGRGNAAIERIAQHARKITMSRLRLAGFAGLLIVAALVGGTIIGSVAAATGTPAPAPAGPGAGQVAPAAPAAVRPAAPGQFCTDFRKAFAAQLGVDESALAPAAKAAAIATVDAAVADGRMTTAVADRLKARIEAANADGCALLAGRIGAVKSALGAVAGVAKDALAAAAGALDMTPADLAAKLRAGDSLKDVATAQGVPYATVSAAVVAAVKADLDAAVSAGTIRQAREDRILARLERNLADGRLRDPRPASPPAPAGADAPSTGS